MKKRVATIQELEKIVTDCGGVLVKTDVGLLTEKEEKEMDNHKLSNEKNKSYKECYQNKGFTFNQYWTEIRKEKWNHFCDGHDCFETNSLY